MPWTLIAVGALCVLLALGVGCGVLWLYQDDREG